MRRILPALIFFAAATILAQSPTPSPTVSPKPSAKPTTKELIDSLTPNDLQEAVSLLKKNFTNPEAINETQLSRATIEGLITRLSPGLILLPDKNAAAAEIAGPFYSEILEKHIGYLRLGALNSANLQTVDKKLAEFAEKKVDALIVDLREKGAGNDFETAAQFAKRFVPKGKTLFTVRKQGKDHVFTSDRDPSYQGLIVIAADSETAGSAEALASALRFYDKALVIGQNTAGRAVEYSDLPLPSGKILRVAISEVVGPDGKSLYPGGVKPDLPVEMSFADKRQIFSASAEKGMSPFIYETERPHLNEAALMAGTNPELESSDQRRGRGQQNALPRDAMLQRALDLITSLEIYQKR
jgi:C-terminal processing protease CtpA/Prc